MTEDWSDVWRLTSIEAMDDGSLHVVVTDPSNMERIYVLRPGDWPPATNDALKAAVTGFRTALARQIEIRRPQEPETDMRWRLVRISVEDESTINVEVASPDGTRKNYPFLFENVELSEGGSIIMTNAADWDYETLFDRGSFGAVMQAVQAVRKAQ